MAGGGAVFLGHGIAGFGSGAVLGNVIAGSHPHCNGGFLGCRWWGCVMGECNCRLLAPCNGGVKVALGSRLWRCAIEKSPCNGGVKKD